MIPKKLFQLLIIFLITSLASCIVVSSTRTSGRICELHQKRMRKILVRTSFGYGAYNYRESPHAKRRVNMGCVVPIWPVRRLAVIYLCPVCDSIKKEKGKQK